MKIQFLIIILAYLFSIPSIASDKTRDYSCEHATFQTSIEGLASLTRRFLKKNTINLEKTIKDTQLEDFEIPASTVFPGLLAWVIPFDSDSTIRFYNQKINSIETSDVIILPTPDDFTIGAEVNYSNFEYQTCVQIIEPDGEVYIENCGIKAQIGPRENLPKVKIEIEFTEHNGPYLPIQIAQAIAKTEIPKDNLHIEILSDDDDDYTWFEWIFDYIANTDFSKSKIHSNSELINQKIASFFNGKIRQIPSTVRELIKIPHIDFRSPSLAVYLDSKIPKLQTALEKYNKALLGKRRKRRKLELPFLFYDHQSMYMNIITNIAEINTEFGMEDFNSLVKLAHESLSIYKSGRYGGTTVKQEITALSEFLDKAKSLSNSDLHKNKTASSKISLVSYSLSKSDSTLRLGIDIDDLNCVPTKSHYSLGGSNSGETRFSTNDNLGESDFGFRLPNSTFNELLLFSHKNKMLRIKVKEKINCPSSHGKCRSKISNVKFTNTPKVSFKDQKHSVSFSKVQLPGSIRANIKSNFSSRACENGNLCLDFYQLNAKGKLTPILKLFNLFLLNMIDVDSRIEEELNKKIAHLNSEGLALIPNAVLTNSIDDQGPYIDFIFKAID